MSESAHEKGATRMAAVAEEERRADARGATGPVAPAVAARGAPAPAAREELVPGPARPARPRRGGYQPADVLVVAYFVITGLLLALFPRSFPGQAAYTAAHATFLALVLLLRFIPRPGHPVPRFLRDWYFFLALPFVYGSLRFLNRTISPRYYDDAVVSLESAIFHGQPSQTLHQLLSWVPLGELLHLCYLLYLTLIPLVGLTLYIRGRREAYRTLATTALATFFFCYLIFILFPVRGPFHHFGPLAALSRAGVFAPLAQGMLHSGSSPGTAFPSSHVAVSIAVWMVCRRYLRRLSHVVGAIAIGIFWATIYGGFHYAIDALAGLVVGIAFGLLGPRLHRWIARRLDPQEGGSAWDGSAAA